MLKSLDMSISHEEERFYQSISTEFKRGFLYDTIVDAFLFNLTKNVKFCKAVQCIDSLRILQHGNSSRFQYPWIKDLSDIEFIFIPFLINSHFILLIVDVRNTTIEFLDPLNNLPCAKTSTVSANWCSFLSCFEPTINFQSYKPSSCYAK